jgi:hypothetical protein
MNANLTIAPTPKAKRDLHPRGQLAYHQRAATRAQSKADWLVELSQRHPDLCPLDVEKHRALSAKALAHLRACTILNDEHSLGFPITQSQRRMLGMA